VKALIASTVASVAQRGKLLEHFPGVIRLLSLAELLPTGRLRSG
jgi:hypothetical protein